MSKLFAEPKLYDMIVIGGQEAKMTQKQSIILEFANYLNQYNFLTINSVVMWEMFLVGFIRRDHASFIKNEQISYIAAGMGNIIGNKGGL
jgi:hypothetical protein